MVVTVGPWKGVWMSSHWVWPVVLTFLGKMLLWSSFIGGLNCINLMLCATSGHNLHSFVIASK